MNLDHIADDIRQVMEVQRNQPEPQPVVGRVVQLTVTTESSTSGTIGPGGAPTFDLAAEVAKETQRALADHTKRLDLLQADMTQAMIDFGRSEVENRMVAAIRDAAEKGAKW